MSDFRPGLDEALHAARTNAGGGHPMDRQPNCTVCILIDHATPGPVRDTLISCTAGRISGRALYRSLRELGIQVSREAILNHRNEAHQP